MIRLTVLLLVLLLQACGSNNVFFVHTIPNNKIIIDGEQNEALWAQAQSIIHFQNPWNSKVGPATALSILKDEKNLYFFFRVTDDDLVEAADFITERDVEKEDRVELFFSKDKNMYTYYCFEMDARGRTLSYGAQFYRQLNFDWEPPEGFRIKSTPGAGGYAVEGAIPLAFLNALAKDNKVHFGAYRAEFSRQGNTIEENWLTWINPKTVTPDFHVPASLGILDLGK